MDPQYLKGYKAGITAVIEKTVKPLTMLDGAAFEGLREVFEDLLEEIQALRDAGPVTDLHADEQYEQCPVCGGDWIDAAEVRPDPWAVWVYNNREIMKQYVGKQIAIHHTLGIVASADTVEEVYKTVINSGLNLDDIIFDIGRGQIMKKSIWDNHDVPSEFLGKWRSVEIECLFKTWEIKEEFVKFVESKEYSDLITLKDDGSIHGDGESAEIVVSFRKGDERILVEVCQFLKDRAFVNKTCGTHVHFDMRHVTPRKVQLYGNRLVKAIPALKLILPKSRRNNEFCALDINKLATCNCYDYDCEKCAAIEDDDRYAFVNLHAYGKHKTIEVRGHSGTINSKKILNWIRICEVIMSSKQVSNKIETVSKLIESYKFNKKIQAYINERYQALNPTDPELVSELSEAA